MTRAWDPRRDASAARELASTLRSLDLDVLHTHNPKTGVLGRLLGRAVRIPVVVNTSFNTRSEPIVCTPEDALACYFTTALDALAIGPFLLQKV